MSQELTFDAVCAIVGRLYLESHHQLENMRQLIASLNARVSQTERERDAALKAMVSPSPPSPIEESER